MKINHPLMYNNFTETDLLKVKELFKKKKYYFNSVYASRKI